MNVESSFGNTGTNGTIFLENLKGRMKILDWAKEWKALEIFMFSFFYFCLLKLPVIAYC